MRNRELKQLAKLVSKEENLTLKEVEDIVDAPFLFQEEIMRNHVDRKAMKFPSVRIPYWGIFFAPKWKIEKFRKKNETI